MSEKHASGDIPTDKIIEIESLPEFSTLNDGDILSELEKNQESIENELNGLLLELDEAPPKDFEVSSLGDKVVQKVIDGILGPFGLSRSMFMDKTGGEVTTSFNAEKGVFAKEKEVYRREEYTKGFSKSRQSSLDKAKDGTGWKDEYSGLWTDRPDVDHIVSLEKYHKEYGGWMQTKEARQAFGNDTNNHAVTDMSVNRSMQQKDIKDWESRPNSQDPSVTNKEFYELDDRRVNAKVKQGEKAANEHAPAKSEAIKYQAKQLGIAGVKTGLKLAARQAVGVALKIFVETTYSAIKEAIAKWKEKVITTVKEFIVFVVNKLKMLKDDLGDILKQIGGAALQGGIAGVLSTLVTFLINSFITTAARLVTVIREAVNTVTLTIKTLCDKSASKEERTKAALDVFISGMAVCIGGLLVEGAKKLIEQTPLAGMADEAANVLVNILTGLIGVLVFWLISKLSSTKAAKEEKANLEKKLDHIFSLEQWRMVNSSAMASVQVQNTARALFGTIAFAERAWQDWDMLLKIQEEFDRKTDENLRKSEEIQSEINNKTAILKSKRRKIN